MQRRLSGQYVLPVWVMELYWATAMRRKNRAAAAPARGRQGLEHDTTAAADDRRHDRAPSKTRGELLRRQAGCGLTPETPCRNRFANLAIIEYMYTRRKALASRSIMK